MRRSTRQTRRVETRAIASSTSVSVRVRQPRSPVTRPRRAPQSRAQSEFLETDDEDEYDEKPKKRRKVQNDKVKGNALLHGILSASASHTSLPAALPPARHHPITYHRPLLLDHQNGRAARSALLEWFATESSKRGMPWRKPWINPSTFPSSKIGALRTALEIRAYEVWISEIMLQQTRVAVVIDYWTRWMSQWPTIQDLAAAEPDDVLAAWRGLGYYSRATRIHQAAKLVVGDGKMKGMLPADVAELESKVPGVGRYTAGAISAIVFGRAAPMVDGNVLRVLSRQMGVYGDVKGDKRVIDVLWGAAAELVKEVAKDAKIEGEVVLNAVGEEMSDRPGKWGQALMELGSTVCIPKPKCEACPITKTCRAYGEGMALAVEAGVLPAAEAVRKATPIDVEDACTFCQPFEIDGNEEEIDSIAASNSKPGKDDAPKSKSIKKRKAATTSQNFSEPAAVETIASHTRRFPLKKVKKPIRQEELLICAIHHPEKGYLIQQRPEKGLLAGLWEFPSMQLPESNASTAAARKKAAKSFLDTLLSGGGDAGRRGAQASSSAAFRGAKHLGELGIVPWTFSHLKSTMHVHLFVLEGGDAKVTETPLRASGATTVQRRWASGEEVEEASMGTGMRKCWALVEETTMAT